MYALLARRPVFRGKSLADMLHMQRFEQPEPLRKHAPDAPEELERILAQLLEKDPNRRVPNANILGRRLEAMLQALSASPATAAADRNWSRARRAIRGRGGRAATPRRATSLARRSPTGPDAGLPATQVLPPTCCEAGPPAAEAVPAGQKPTGLAGGAPQPAATSCWWPRRSWIRPPPRSRGRRCFPWRTSWQTWVLAGALLSVGLTICWFLQPPTADALYQRIDARASDSSPDALPEAEGDIGEFLTRYPNDPRAGRLRGYEKEIDLYWLEKRFERRVKGLAGAEGLRPIEQAYLGGARIICSWTRTWHSQAEGDRRSLQRVGRF